MSSGIPPNEQIRLEPGLKLDRYELLRVLANGGMGAVWLARVAGKHGFEKVFALKTVLPQHAPDEKYRNMFLDEARLASRIAHPNVAQTIDLGETQGVLYFVMEWVDGDSLRRLRAAVTEKGTPFPVGIALRIMSEACAGADAAHELTNEDGSPLNVVHRDISPHNILVSVRGSAKVIDFGIAKARARLAEATRSDEMKGKVDYIAPEQAMGSDVDRRADIWSLGAVLYYLVAGVPPFEADTAVAALMARINGKKHRELGPDVPPVVKAVIDKALARQPADRYATAADMQRAIEEASASVGRAVTAKDVAAFLKENLAEAIEARRVGVEMALDEASRRSKKNLNLEATLEDPGSFAENPAAPISGRINVPQPPNDPVVDAGSPVSGDAVFPVVAAGVAGLKPTQSAPPDAELARAGLPRRRWSGIAVWGICGVAAGIILVALALRGKPGEAASTSARVAAPPATAIATKTNLDVAATDPPSASTVTAPPSPAKTTTTRIARPAPGGSVVRGSKKPKGPIDDGF